MRLWQSGLQSRFGSETNVCPENKARSSAVLLSYSLKRHAEISDSVATKDFGDEDNPRLHLSSATYEDIPFSQNDFHSCALVYAFVDTSFVFCRLVFKGRKVISRE